MLFFCVFILLSMKTPAPKKIIFFGDSITQAGVSPDGYISVIKNDLAKADAASYDFIGAGIGGNKVYDLYLRLDDDVLSKQPDVVVIYVGVNDVWHKKLTGTGTDADKFVKFYQALINKIQAQKAKIVLCTPAVIGEKKDGENEMDADLNKYSDLIRTLAKENNLPLCDLRKLFLDHDLKNNPENKDRGILTTDGVHLTKLGNQLVAKEVFSKIR